MSAADYLLCDGCGRKVYYRNEAGDPGDQLPDGAVLFCGDCAPHRVLPAHVNAVVVATTGAAAGFTERVEWSTEPSLTPRYVATDATSAGAADIVCTVADAQQAMRDYVRGMRERPAIVRRTVYTGPWEVVDV